MYRRPPFDPSRLHEKPTAEAEFVAALALRQDAQDVTDQPFAKSLGVSCALWRQTRSGRLDLSWRLLAAGSDLVPYSVAAAAHASLLSRAKRRTEATRNAA